MASLGAEAEMDDTSKNQFRFLKYSKMIVTTIDVVNIYGICGRNKKQ